MFEILAHLMLEYALIAELTHEKVLKICPS
jgi:hypothetical protein